MPKRSNPFQDLVALLERQLAPDGCSVSESKLLKDIRTGEEREVDIFIEGQIGVHPIRIAIEVIDYARPASTPWIESISQKHADLHVDKSIAVSRSGFYKPALLKASGLKIETLTIEQALALDWRAKIDEMPAIRIESFLLPYLKSASVLVEEESSLDELKDCTIGDLVLYRPSGDVRGTLQSLLQSLLASEGVIGALRSKAFVDGATLVEGEFRFPDGSYIPGRTKERVLVTGIIFQASCKKEITELRIQKGRYRDTAVVLAEGQTFGHRVAVAVTESKGGDPTISFRLRKRKTL